MLGYTLTPPLWMHYQVLDFRERITLTIHTDCTQDQLSVGLGDVVSVAAKNLTCRLFGGQLIVTVDKSRYLIGYLVMV